MTEEDIKAEIKKLIPDPLLRESFRMEWAELAMAVYGLGLLEKQLKMFVYENIAFVSYVKIYAPTYLAVWNAPQEIEAGLKLYDHTADWLYWLLEQMIQDEFTEGIVIVEKEIERRGFNRQNVTERFEL